MAGRVNIWVFVAILFIFETNGFSLFDFSSSSEEIEDFELDNDSAIDESDYWALLSDSSKILDVERAIDDKKWEEIDNLDLIDDAEDDLEMVQFNEYSEVNVVRNYTFGKRVRGDGVVGFSTQNQNWKQPQNFKLNMTYPAKGFLGKNVTYVEIQVNQTSMLGHAYVVRGGIGKRFIGIMVEAYQTFYFNYRATLYGK